MEPDSFSTPRSVIEITDVDICQLMCQLTLAVSASQLINFHYIPHQG